MIHTITCAINSSDALLVQQFTERLASAGITATDLTSPGSRYIYFDLCWDDAYIPAIPKHTGTHRAGAKPKKLLYEDSPATCGLVWQLREQDHLSDAEIGSVLDASESTITRRRKKHLADGNFHPDSAVIF